MLVATCCLLSRSCNLLLALQAASFMLVCLYACTCMCMYALCFYCTLSFVCFSSLIFHFFFVFFCFFFYCWLIAHSCCWLPTFHGILPAARRYACLLLSLYDFCFFAIYFIHTYMCMHIHGYIYVSNWKAHKLIHTYIQTAGKKFLLTLIAASPLQLLAVVFVVGVVATSLARWLVDWLATCLLA